MGTLTILKSVLSIVVCPQIKKRVIIDDYDLKLIFFLDFYAPIVVAFPQT